MTHIQKIVVLVSAFIAIGAILIVNFYQPSGQQVRTTGTALVGGPFQLTGHDGSKVSDEQYRGKYMLVFFGYTYCPDVCPAGLQVMTSALDELGSDANTIQPLFITIDPERDTVDVMASYVENFHERMVGLTGSADQIADVAKAYRVYYKKAGDDADYLMDHSSILYLMGPDGKFLKHYVYGTDSEALAKQIKQELQ